MPKSKWDDVKEKLILVEGWCRDGLTDEQIAYNLGIGVSTLYKYKNEHIELVEVLKKSKEVVDRQVENALLKSALGFTYTEQTVTKDGDVVTIEKYERPSNTAQIFWLKNRKREAWRDKQDIEHSGTTNSNVNIDLSNVSTEDLKKLLK